HPSLDHLVDGDLGDGELTHFKDFLDGGEGVEKAHDPDGHGSHVIGILAARGPYSHGLFGGVELDGGAPGIELVVARVCDAKSCATDRLPEAIRWAVQTGGADILSLSLGGQEGGIGLVNDLLQDDLEAAIQEAIDAGVVVIASAGNDGPDNLDISTPANIPDVIAVGAIQRGGVVWTNSSRGDDAGNPCRTFPPLPTVGRCDPSKKPELVAPGVDILSAWTGNGFAVATGTSQATPFVTAVVAILLEDHPALRGREDVLSLKRALMETARPVAGQREPHDDAAGYGIVQADAALRDYA
ncbi:MAG TPA: S8 family serine peptidase, partial [Candidatus Thermoplasmatota archaeon]|nr:S8 family serine peptidase [Candidatus Thermoplasmatota archaeon]